MGKRSCWEAMENAASISRAYFWLILSLLYSFLPKCFRRTKRRIWILYKKFTHRHYKYEKELVALPCTIHWPAIKKTWWQIMSPQYTGNSILPRFTDGNARRSNYNTLVWLFGLGIHPASIHCHCCQAKHYTVNRQNRIILNQALNKDIQNIQCRRTFF